MVGDKRREYLEKQIKILKKGKSPYYIKVAFYFAIGGLLVYSFIVIFGGANGFDFMEKERNPLIRHGISAIICSVIFGLGGIFFARRFWWLIPWTIFSESLKTGTTTKREIISKYGEPNKIKEKKNSQEFLYNAMTNNIDNMQLSYRNVMLVFKNEILERVYRL